MSSGTAAAKVKAKVAATSRPHTLRIQLSGHHHHHHNSSMASDESIGSCSLDVDVTASDASGTFRRQRGMVVVPYFTRTHKLFTFSDTS